MLSTPDHRLAGPLATLIMAALLLAGGLAIARPVAADPTSAPAARATVAEAGIRNLAAVQGYLLYNPRTNQCVDPPGQASVGNGAELSQYRCAFGDNQEFVLDDTGLTAPGSSYRLYTIYNFASGRCVDLDGTGAVGPGARVKLYDCVRNHNDNQLFWLWQDFPGGDLFVNHKSNLCLEVTGPGTGAPGAGIHLYHCTADRNDDHLWLRWYP